MFRIDHGLYNAGVTALTSYAVEGTIGRDRVGGHFLRSTVIPFAHNFGDLPGLSRGIKRLVNAVVAVCIG
jgi:hypothetical protein